MIDFEMPISRRAAVLGGLGLAASIPMTALADTVAKVGYKADGSAYQGLVTMHGKTYLYEGGVLFKGGQKEYKGSRYFSTSDGHMAVNEDVKWTDGTTHHYGANGLLNDATELGEGGIAAGWYTMKRKNSVHVLDAYCCGTSNGTAIELYDSNDTCAQKWYISWSSAAKAYKIESPAALIEVADYSHAAVNSNLQIWTAAYKSDGSPYLHQYWRAMKAKDGSITFLNADTGFAFGCGADENNSRAVLQEVDYSDKQSWVLTPCAQPSGWSHVNGTDDWAYAGGDGKWVRGWQYINGEWYYLHSSSNGVAAKGVATVDGRKHYFNNDCKWRAVDEAAAPEGTAVDDGAGHVWPAFACAAWDFTDWAFVEEALNNARADGSNTNYYIYIKWTDPCRMVICRRSDNNAWVAVGGWYCAVGRRRYSDWVPRGCAGTFKITQRWWRSNTGPGCAMDYIEHYTGDGTPGARNNDSASYHGNMWGSSGMVPGDWGYTTHSCISVTNARAEWLYNNIPLQTNMRNVGEMYGYGNGSDSNLRPAELYHNDVQNPFA